ncbi:roadblock/LC7 domain-containing protein [uncultured Stenotrophomonas sp.]|jgi:predicted regulator of Ras-like GTPase activity (Roadblock/LC7/MglB family)|uniref:roadblock/LC7 domain-containing protein n=1 Tax=uncultured Stenotrophomonas sp. TaxID=165438 RepID=UPI0028D0CEB3|nr:roadblock/LC7 domain-containing protein [uncultured Stenotrophomonas sp.]
MADGYESVGLDPAARDRVLGHLQAFADDINGVRSVVLASVDGFALVPAAGTHGNGERLAAMTSAMLALAAAVGRELALGELEVLMLEANDGKVLMLALPCSPAPLLLMTACDTRCVTGKVLWSAKECGRNIMAELSGSRADPRGT